MEEGGSTLHFAHLFAKPVSCANTQNTAPSKEDELRFMKKKMPTYTRCPKKFWIEI